MLCRPELPRRRLQAAATAAGCVRHDEPPPARAASVALARRVRRPCWHAHWPAWPQDFQCAGWAWRTCRGWAASLAAPAARGGLCVLPGEEIEQRACGGAPAERVGRAGRAQEPAPPQEPSPRTWAARRCRQLVQCTAARLRAACMRAPRVSLSAQRLVDTRAPRSRWLPATASARTALSCSMRRRYARRTLALRTTACSLACSALCAPSAHSLMSVLAVSPRPRKGLLTLSSLPHQLCQVRADGPIRRARDDSEPRRCARRSRCRRRRGQRR